MLIIYLQPYNPYISNQSTPQWVGRNYAGTHDDDMAMPFVNVRVDAQCCKVADRCS